MKKKWIVAVMCALTVLTGVIALSACNDSTGNEHVGVSGIKLNMSEGVCAVNDKLMLMAEVEPKNADNDKIIWESTDPEVASVDNKGTVSAVKAGQVTITATTDEGKYQKKCIVIVGDVLASPDFEEGATGFGTTRFKTAAEAVSAAPKGGSVVLLAGDYGEQLELTQDIKIKGAGKATLSQIKCADGISVEIEGIGFKNESYPKENEGVITLSGGRLTLKECTFEVVSAEARVGGYAVFVSQNAELVSIQKCEFTNYRYAAYLKNTGGVITVKNNKLTRCDVGIGVNIKVGTVPTSEENYTVSGEVSGNEYIDVNEKTQYVYGGERPQDFNFAEHPGK